MALPGTGMIVGIGKDNRLRLVDTSNMGVFNSTVNADVQEFQAASSGIFIGTPVYWSSPNFGL